MSFAEIKSKVNSDFNTPLNHTVWINDIKFFGQDSYVYRDKDKLSELYKDYALSLNDEILRTDALAAVIKDNTEIGKAFSHLTTAEYANDFKVDGEFITSLSQLFSTYSAFKHLSTDLAWVTEEEAFLDVYKSFTEEIVALIEANIADCEDTLPMFLDLWGADEAIQTKITANANTFATYFSYGGGIVKQTHKSSLYKMVYDNELADGNIKETSTQMTSEDNHSFSTAPVVGRYLLGGYVTQGCLCTCSYTNGDVEKTVNIDYDLENETTPISGESGDRYNFIIIESAVGKVENVTAESGYAKLYYLK